MEATLEENTESIEPNDKSQRQDTSQPIVPIKILDESNYSGFDIEVKPSKEKQKRQPKPTRSTVASPKGYPTRQNAKKETENQGESET